MVSGKFPGNGNSQIRTRSPLTPSTIRASAILDRALGCSSRLGRAAVVESKDAWMHGYRFPKWAASMGWHGMAVCDRSAMEKPRRHRNVMNFSAESLLRFASVPPPASAFLLATYRGLCVESFSQLSFTLLARHEAPSTTETTTILGRRSTRHHCIPVPAVCCSPTREHCLNWRY